MATVYKTEFGITAFNSNDRLVMLDSRPMVNWGFSLEKLEDSLTTLEEVMNIVPPCHRYSLETLYFSLKAASPAESASSNSKIGASRRIARAIDIR